MGNTTTNSNKIENNTYNIRRMNNTQNYCISIVSINDMSKEELQQYLDTTTQLIPIKEDQSTEQYNVNDTTNDSFGLLSLNKLLSIGGSHLKE